MFDKKVIGALLVGMLVGGVLVLLLMAGGCFDPRPPSDTHSAGGGQASNGQQANRANWGSFPNTPKVELLNNGRQLRLTEDFVYLDPRGKTWTAPKDSIVDGASIPRLFWSITGGPLEGRYRNASIVHDVGCDRMIEPWENVHLMFYEACRCGGIEEIQAKILYAAVYHFGPRWKRAPVMMVQTVREPDGMQRQVEVQREVGKPIPVLRPSDKDRQTIESYVKEKNPSLDDLRKLFPTQPE